MNIYAERKNPEEYNAERSMYDVPFSTSILHVPSGCKEAYASTDPWHNFPNIIEDIDPTAIRPTIISYSDDEVTYFNLHGQRVAKPGRGIYIVGGKKILK